MISINIENRTPDHIVIHQAGIPWVMQEDPSGKGVFDLAVFDESSTGNIEQSYRVITSILSNNVIHSHIVDRCIIWLANLKQLEIK